MQNKSKLKNELNKNIKNIKNFLNKLDYGLIIIDSKYEIMFENNFYLDNNSNTLFGNIKTLLNQYIQKKKSLKIIKFNNREIKIDIFDFVEDTYMVMITYIKDSYYHELIQYKSAIYQANIVSKTDKNGIITFANKNFCEISGYKLNELLGKNHNIVRHPEMPKKVFKEIWSIIKKKKIWKGEIKNKKKDGSYYRVFSTIIPILDKNNEIKEFLSLRSDITKQKDFENQLLSSQKIEISKKKEIIKQLNKMAQTKDDFIKFVSHEIRTPMTIIKGYSSMLIEGDFGKLENGVSEKILKIYNITNDLMSFVNNLLNVTKLEYGIIQIENQQFNIGK